jgi:MYXO-CTERM domain-containing protein
MGLPFNFNLSPPPHRPVLLMMLLLLLLLLLLLHRRQQPHTHAIASQQYLFHPTCCDIPHRASRQPMLN